MLLLCSWVVGIAELSFAKPMYFLSHACRFAVDDPLTSETNCILVVECELITNFSKRWMFYLIRQVLLIFRMLGSDK